MRAVKYFGILAFISLVGLLAVLNTNQVTSSASTPLSPWISENQPTIQATKTYQIQDNSYPRSATSRITCREAKIVTVTGNILINRKEVSHQSCVVDTQFGLVSESGYLQRPDSDVFGKVKTSTGATTRLLLSHRSSTGVTLGQYLGRGHQILFYKDLANNISSSKNIKGEVTHKLPPPSSFLARPDGGHLSIHNMSINFSSDGLWMTGDSPNAGQVRVNLNSGQWPGFYGSPFNYRIGLGPSVVTSVSPSGRYTIVSSDSHIRHHLYDLGSCDTTLGTDIDCVKYDLLPALQSSIPGFRAIVSARFISEHTVSLNVSTLLDGTMGLSNYLMTAHGQKPATFQYLGMGDSFASGEGAYGYKANTDTTSNKCHVSLNSYPYLISSVLGYGSSESIACSGAKTQDVNLETGDYTEKIAQSKEKNDKIFNPSILSQFLPGYRPQKVFTKELNPESITVSIGGNDIGFSDIIKRCLDSDTCYKSYEDRYELMQSIDGIFDDLVQTYTELQQSSSTDTRVYVVGYPQIADPYGNCANNVHLNQEELEFAEDLVRYLNGVIKAAASNVGVFYVDTESAFEGRKMCQTKSWDVAVNGLTVGDDQANFGPIHGPIANESYHPNKIGHDMLKSTIIEKTANLTAPMPSPNHLSSPQPITESAPLLVGRTKTNRAVRYVRQNTGTSAGIIQTGEWAYETNIGRYVSVGSKVKGWLFSEPLYLGEFTVQEEGRLMITADIPQDFPTGFHTLHLYSQNSVGEEIDVVKTVFVQGKTPLGSCVVVPDSGIDYDEDGIDDACDGLIGQKPLVLAAATPLNKTTSTSSKDVASNSPDTDEVAIGANPTAPVNAGPSTESVSNGSMKPAAERTEGMSRMDQPGDSKVLAANIAKSSGKQVYYWAFAVVGAILLIAILLLIFT